MKKEEFLDKKCPICGKGFAVLYPNRWAYKRARTSSQFTYFCSWKCLRANEKRKDYGKMKKLTEEQKQEAIQIALKGMSPVTYLELNCGINNGYQCWKNIRDRLKVNDPETWEKVQKALGEAKSKKKAAKPVDEPTDESVEEDEPKTAGEAFQACLDVADKFFSECEAMGLLKDKKTKAKEAEDNWKAADKALNERVNAMHRGDEREYAPVDIMGYQARAIERKPFGLFFYDSNHNRLDWTTPEGDEISMSPARWWDFIEAIPMVFAILGVDPNEENPS